MANPAFTDILVKIVKDMGLCASKVYKKEKTGTVLIPRKWFYVTYMDACEGRGGYRSQTPFLSLERVLHKMRRHQGLSPHDALAEIKLHNNKVTIKWWSGGQSHYSCNDPDLPTKIEKTLKKIVKKDAEYVTNVFLQADTIHQIAARIIVGPDPK